MIVEYAPYGNLRLFLRGKRPKHDSQEEKTEALLSLQNLVSFSLQIAKGMEYLAERKVRFCRCCYDIPSY